MKPVLHGVAGTMALTLILIFWWSTVISELVLGLEAVRVVKTGILFGLGLLIPALIATGVSGAFLAQPRPASRLLSHKRRRMPIIALNGLLVLVPAAIFLQTRAAAGTLDAAFYGVQALELAAGGANILLLGLNMRDGLKLSRVAPGR